MAKEMQILPTQNPAGLPSDISEHDQRKSSLPGSQRQRASRACEACHSRKVRCDAASLGVPCTNCTAFSIECKIPVPKRKDQFKGTEDSDATVQPSNNGLPGTMLNNSPNGIPRTQFSDAEAAQQAAHDNIYTVFMRPKFARAPVKEGGGVVYLGESGGLTLLVQESNGTPDVTHYPRPDHVRGTNARLTEMDNVEIDILHQRGAFLLPPRAICDELVEAFFKRVAPIVPVVNRSRFMRRYRDTKNPPSLLLLQAIFLAGSKVCTNPQLGDVSGSTTAATMTFYKRAKALYDAGYEDDRITIVQALTLMGWCWDEAEDMTKNVFYWSTLATTIAQGSGMHRSVENSPLSRPDKRLWKRIWWTVFTRDRIVAVALGQPVHINMDDSDVDLLTEEDFIEDEVDTEAEYTPDPTHVQFFLQYVKLCEILGITLNQQYSIPSKRSGATDVTYCDRALAAWKQGLPRELFWERQKQIRSDEVIIPLDYQFWSAILHSNYHTTLCLLYRAHMSSTTSQGAFSRTMAHATDDAPSRTLAFQAAVMITSIVRELQAHGELRFTPAFIVYSLSSALTMHFHQMRLSTTTVDSATQDRIDVCMSALKEISKVWPAAKMVHTLFETILSKDAPDDRRLETAVEGSSDRYKQNTTQNSQYSNENHHAWEPSDPHEPPATLFRTATLMPSLASENCPEPIASPSNAPQTVQPFDTLLNTGSFRDTNPPASSFNMGYATQFPAGNHQPDQMWPWGTDISFARPFAHENPYGEALDPQLQKPRW